MRLESAMFSGREGITAHGQAIAVVGDNIANVNTTAYKNSRAEFSDIFSNVSASDSIPSAGSGVKVSGVRQLIAPGSLESTGRELDVGIDGNGFFMVGTAEAPLYTRAGNFSLSASGELVTPDGFPVLGLPAGGGALGPLNVNNVNLAGAATETGTISGNLDPSLAITAAPENPQSFRELGQLGGFTSTIRIFDSLGAGHDVNMYYFRSAQNEWNVRAYVDGGEVGGVAGQPALIGQTNLAFGADGSIPEANQAAAAIAAQNIAWGNGAAAGNFSLSFAEFTQFAAPSSIRGNNQDGQSVGSIIGYAFNPSGAVEAVLDSGSRQAIGTIQLADFNNRDGLQRIGSNLYQANADLGARDPGDPGTSSLGLLQSGALELSSVDLSSEFVDLVLYQRGYQANSQTIQAVNQLLQNTIALIR